MSDTDRPDHPDLRVALVGYGLAGSAFHAPLIDAVDGLALAAVVTSDPGRAAAVQARHPRAMVVPDAERVWDTADRFDVVVIATPNRTHVPLAMAALEAGLHVVVDKPIAPTVTEARRLIEEAARRDRVLTVYQNRRWDGDFLTLGRLLDAGELGDVYRFESRFERWRPEPKPGWRQDPDPEEAGGLLFDLGAHLVDQALRLFGPVRSVHAELHARRPGARVDDDAFLALDHESGVRSHLWMSLVAAAPGPRFRVLGARGSWVRAGLDVQEAQLRGGMSPLDPAYGIEPRALWGVLHDGEATRPTPPERGAYPAFYEAVARAIRDGGPPPVEAESVLPVLEILERHAAAFRAGRGPS